MKKPNYQKLSPFKTESFENAENITEHTAVLWLDNISCVHFKALLRKNKVICHTYLSECHPDVYVDKFRLALLTLAC